MTSQSMRGGQPERPEVDVLVELEPHPEEDSPFDQSGRRRHPGCRIADGAEQKGVETAPLLERLVVEHRPVLEVPVRPEVVVGPLVRHAGRIDHLERLGDDLRADAVAADHADPVGHVLFAFLSRFPDQVRPGKRKPPTMVDG